MQSALIPILAMTLRSLGWFPVWLLLLNISKQPQDKLLICSAMLFGCGLLCGLWQRFRKLKLRRRMKSLTAALLILPPAAAGIGIYLLTQRLVTAAAMPLVMMIFCIRGAERDSEQLYSRTNFVFTVTGAVLTLLMFSIAKLSDQTVLIFTLTASVSGGFLLLRNQCMLERLVSRRSDGEGIVPKEIRRHNLRLVLGIFVIVGLLLLVRGPLTDLFTGAARGLVTLFVMGARWLTRAVSGAEGDAPDVPEETEIGQQPAGETFGNASQLWDLLIIPVLILLIYFIRLVFQSYAYDIREWFWRLREKLHREAPVREITAQTGEYTDTETDVLPEEAAGSRAKRRMWTKQLKEWEKSPDTPEKFYLGYQLLLAAPAWDPLPEDADTVLEIREKWRKYREDELDRVTDEFQNDRYAMNGLAPAAVSDMQTALEAVSKLKYNGV